MSEKEKEGADEKKVEGSQGGKQLWAIPQRRRRRGGTLVLMLRRRARRPRKIRRIFDGMGRLIKRGLKGTRGRKQRTRKKRQQESSHKKQTQC